MRFHSEELSNTSKGISHAGYHLQTLGNALYFIVSVIAALLYGNIGIKVLYTAILEDVLKFPPLASKKGKWTWVVLGTRHLSSTSANFEHSLTLNTSSTVLGLSLHLSCCSSPDQQSHSFRGCPDDHAIQLHVWNSISSR